jgi:serine/threonine protein kinase
MIGTLLGNRYELLEQIGEGGMAIVYKAKCHLLDRYVAVKVLKEEFNNDEDFVEKFKNEATAAASLSHTNIVNIYDVGSENNINYIVMEYVNGKTLKRIIKENVRLSYSKTINIAIQIASALECAHKNNLIHRDIKPHNILVTEEGIAKVADFGIAKVANSMTITNSSQIIGSAHYFSPEQAKGGFVDCKTDIYSLGIVMYEMVTGKVPYDADSAVSVAIKHIQEPAVPPKQIIWDIPESLNRLILKAIEKEPIKRYQSAKEMLNDLNRIKQNSNSEIKLSSMEDDFTKVMAPVNISNKVNNEDFEDEEDEDEEKKPQR